jgi:hypothetical protein
MFKVGDKILVISSESRGSEVFPLGVQIIKSVNNTERLGTTEKRWSYYYDNSRNTLSKYVPATNLTLLLWEGND